MESGPLEPARTRQTDAFTGPHSGGVHTHRCEFDRNPGSVSESEQETHHTTPIVPLVWPTHRGYSGFAQPSVWLKVPATTSDMSR
jgi:hypothetical protein